MPITGLTRPDHIGITVPDLDQAREFLVDMLGYEYQRTQPPRDSDVGGHHIPLYVEDLDAAVTDLRRRGLRVLGEPTAGKGAHEGQRWVYFLSPWSMRFELVSFPGGKAFDRDPDAFT